MNMIEPEEKVNGYYLCVMSAENLYKALKQEVRFEVMVECLKMLNKDLRGCLQDNKEEK